MLLVVINLIDGIWKTWYMLCQRRLLKLTSSSTSPLLRGWQHSDRMCIVYIQEACDLLTYGMKEIEMFAILHSRVERLWKGCAQFCQPLATNKYRVKTVLLLLLNQTVYSKVK